MKRTLFLLLFTLATGNLFAQKALKVFIIRHAESEAGMATDAGLTEKGIKQADLLMKKFKDIGLDSIFTTNYMRSKLTVSPLADRIGLPIKVYDPQEQDKLAKGLLKNAQGKKILMVAHLDTAMPLIEAFGGAKPLAEMKDGEYDWLFELSIKDDKANVKTSKY